MRQQRTQRMSTPAPMYGSGTDLPTTGYALIVDGQVKREFSARDPAVMAARDLKGRFPVLQVQVYDAETKLSEKIELAAA